MAPTLRIVYLAFAGTLAACGTATGTSSRSARGDKPGSDKLCQVYAQGGGLRPGVGVVIGMRVGNDRSCTWGFSASGFGGVTGGSSARHGVSLVDGSGGRVVYSYTPDHGYVGSDSFTFSISRGDGYDNPFTVNVEGVPGGNASRL